MLDGIPKDSPSQEVGFVHVHGTLDTLQANTIE
jgi:hypothetical protein